jgi:CP family cyanate transporter-like MFS transporter
MATTSLSAFTQCCGYLIASIGPLGFGLLFDLSGGWTVPLLAMCVVVAIQAIAGCLAVRPRFVEDELERELKPS